MRKECDNIPDWGSCSKLTLLEYQEKRCRRQELVNTVMSPIHWMIKIGSTRRDVYN